MDNCNLRKALLLFEKLFMAMSPHLKNPREVPAPKTKQNFISSHTLL